MGRLLGLMYSIYFSIKAHRKIFSTRFGSIPDLNAVNLNIEAGFFAGPNLYIRGNRYCAIRIEGKVLFGPDVMLLGGNHITNRSYEHIYDYNEDDPSSKDIVVKKGAWIGARTILLSGAVVGEGTIVGCSSVVNRELKPYSIYAGSPAKFIRARFTKVELISMLKNTGSELNIESIPVQE